MSNATPTGHPRVIEEYMERAFREIRPQTRTQRHELALGGWKSPGPYIKTCGMFRAADITSVNLSHPDFCGFVVDVPASHRSVTPAQVLELSATLNPAIISVGVFVDEDEQVIAQLVEDGGIDVVQLHGHEDEGYIARLRELTDANIIQAFKVRGPEDLARAEASSAEMVLLDSGSGSGETFDWQLLGGFTRPYLLAGGLTCDNLRQALEGLHPWGVDLSSGLETNRLKDRAKLLAACAIVRSME